MFVYSLCDYVDLLQVHEVEFAPLIDVIVNETLPAIDRLRERGLCQFIGITGYPIKVLRAVLERSPGPPPPILFFTHLVSIYT